MSDTRILFSILVFIGVFGFTQAMFQTEIITTNEAFSSNYSANASQLGTSAIYIAPPVCKPPESKEIDEGWRGSIQEMFSIIEAGGSQITCFTNYAIWMVQLMFFVSTIDWFNAIIMLAITGTIGFIILRFIRGVG